MNRKRFRLTIIIIPLLFYLGIAIYDGTVWCVDSPSYTSMDFSREPLYPLFLLMFRKIFEFFDFAGTMYGQPSYLFMAVIVQSLLWAYTASRLGIFVCESIAEKYEERKAVLFGYMAAFLQMAVASLNRFASNRGSMYSECIMTEALAMPLFVIFNIRLFELIKEYNKKNLIAVFLLCVIISSIRKQMLITALIWGFVSFVLYIFVRKYKNIKRFMHQLLLITAAVVLISAADRGYNFALRGVFAEHTGNSRGALCTVLYTASADDRMLFEKYDLSEDYPQLGSLYMKIYEECFDRELTIDFAPGYQNDGSATVFNSDWAAMASHYADSYDIIGFDIVLPFCQEYVAEHFPELEGVYADIKEDEVERALMKELFLSDIKGVFSGRSRAFLYVLTSNIVKAFVISVANMNPAVLIKAAAVIYALYIILFMRMLVLRREKSADIILFSFIVLVGTAVNSVVTGSMIFPQPRYMCYEMGLFYLTAFCGIMYQ